MSNPFDKPDGRFHVLTNERGEYSLWPFFIQVPAGWTSRAEGGRQECLDYIAENWIDMRPKRSVEEEDIASDLPASMN
jgi:MbtH protein